VQVADFDEDIRKLPAKETEMQRAENNSEAGVL
jgi:hypothetical protein